MATKLGLIFNLPLPFSQTCTATLTTLRPFRPFGPLTMDRAFVQQARRTFILGFMTSISASCLETYFSNKEFYIGIEVLKNVFLY